MVGDRLSASSIEGRWRRKASDVPAEEGIIPTSKTWEELSGLSSAELAAQYPKRYQIYLEVLRGRRQLEGDVSIRRWLGMMNRLDKHIAKEHAGEDATLKPEQLDVFQDIREHFEKGETEGFIVLPTGVGKTVIFVELAEAFNCKTVVVVPTKELISQARDEFTQFASDLSVGVYYQDEKQLGKQVTVTTYDSLRALITSGKLDPKTIDLLVLDEAHKSLTKKRSELVQSFGQSLILGVTATDAYAEDKQLKQLLNHAIHRMHLREAIERGLLCNTAAAVVKTDVDLSSVPIIDGQYDPTELENKFNTPALNQATVDLYQKQHTGDRGIAFCTGIKHAKALAKKFQEAGIPAAAIYGSMPRTQRRELIAQHRSGELMILTNDKVLREGYNVPEASVCLNLDPTSSVVNATQRGGRVTRVDKNEPNKLATIYDFLPIRDPRKPLVLFAAVLGGSVVLQMHAPDSYRGGRYKPPIDEDEPDIPGVKVIYGADEIIRVTQLYGEGKKEITPDDIRATLREQGVAAKDWLKLGKKERNKLRVKGLGLWALSSLFGFEFSTSGLIRVSDFEKLCRAIFGNTEVEQAQSELSITPERIRATILVEGATAKDWLLMHISERRKLIIHGLGLEAIAYLFLGERTNPIGINSDFQRLCRAIFGDQAVDQGLSEIAQEAQRDTISQRDEIIQALVLQGVQAKDWLGKSHHERRSIAVNGLQPQALARLFGIVGNPNENSEAFEKLCRAIFGDEAVDKAIIDLLATPEAIRKALATQGTTAKDWLTYSGGRQSQLKVGHLSLYVIGNMFGVKGDVRSNNEAFEKLCRTIFGEDEVDKALQDMIESKKEAMRKEIQRQGIKAKDWLLATPEQRKHININGMKIFGIAAIFGIKVNGPSPKAFEAISRVIWGDAEVNAALAELPHHR